jgi:hypothetical protein
MTLTGKGFRGVGNLKGDEIVEFRGTVVGGGVFKNETGNVTAGCKILSSSDSEIRCQMARPSFPSWFALSPSASVVMVATVKVNSITAPSACAPNGAVSSACNLTLSGLNTPTVSSATFNSGTNTLTIVGSLFDQGTVSVKVGTKACAVQSFSATNITCAVADDRDGIVPVSVHVASKGWANYTTANGLAVTHSHDLRLDGISIPRGSTAGGLVVALIGYGFDADKLDKNKLLGIGLPGSGELVPFKATYRKLWVRMPHSDAPTATTTVHFLLEVSPPDDADAPVVLGRRSRQLALAARENDGLLHHSMVEESSHPLHAASLHQELLATPSHHEHDESLSLHLTGAPVLRLSGEQVRTAVSERRSAMLAQIDPIHAAGRERSLAAGHADRRMRRLAGIVQDDHHGRRLAAGRTASASLMSGFVYDPALQYTPQMYSITPTSGTKGTLVTIKGNGLLPDTATDNNSSVTIGAAPCAVRNMTGNWSVSTIVCTVGESYGGSHRVEVLVDGKGLAHGSTVFVASSQLAGAVAPSAVSFEGGAVVTFQGRGFPTIPAGYSATDSAVASRMPQAAFCGLPCTVVESSFTELKCRAGNLSTAASVAALWNVPPAPLTGTAFGASTGSSTEAFRVRSAVDGDPGTEYRQVSSSNKCTVGLDLGPLTVGIVTRVRFFPSFRVVSAYNNAVFQGAMSLSGPWTEITRVQGRVNEGWNWIEVIRVPGVSNTTTEGLPPSALASAPAFRYVRVVGNSGTSYCGMEVEFNGFALSAEAHANSGSCRGSLSLARGTAVTSGTGTALLPSTTGLLKSFVLNYTTGATPRVTSISPNNGTALGGTAVRLTGSGFSTTAVVSVKFNGVACTVTAVDSAGVTCTTGKRDAIRAVSVEVTVSGLGRATVDTSRVYFRYLDRWSQLTTWLNQEPPVEGDSVVVPYGQAVLMDVSPPKLFLFLIEGEVIFDRRDLTLDATYVWVHGGTLEIGTEAEPFVNKATVTLHGDRWKDIELPHIGAKVLAVMDRNGGMTRRAKDGFVVIPRNMGRLDVHGIPRVRTWCRIAQDATPGSRDLYTSEDVDWAPGETLVITPSSRNFLDAEEMVVAEVVGPRHLRMREPFKRLHVAQIVSGAPYGHSDMDMRAAVGLLTRNVVIQGDSGSYAQHFGGHTMAAHGGIYRIENAEIRHCGQGFILGRYCTHHHMSGALASMSYVSANSIHHSNQRIATIHGTRYYTVKHNVGYDVHGHSVFVEDGAERWNRIEENLIMVTRRCFSCLKSDTKPANFWMAGPNQYHRHNYAGGSASEGFWYELPGTPHGPSATPEICPVHDHVGEFFNNTATAAGLHGLRLYPVVLPFKDPCDEGSGPLPQYYVNFTSFRNGGHGIFGKLNGDLHHINPKLAENAGDELFWTKLEKVVYNDNPHVVNLLAIAKVDGTYSGGKVGLFAPQNEYFYVKGATFVNYGDAGAISGCAKCDSHTDMKQGGYTTRFEGLRFVNSPRRVKWTAPYKQIFWDLDGSLTDQSPAGGWLMPYHKFNDWRPACRGMGDASAIGTDGQKYDGGIRCDDSVVVRRMQMDGFQPNELQWQELAVHSPGVGTGNIMYREKEIAGWVFPLVAGKFYSLFFRSQIDWRQYAMRYSEPDYVGSHANRHNGAVKEWVGFHQNWTDYRDHIEVHYPNRPSSDTYATERLPIERGYVRGDASNPGPAPPLLYTPNLPLSGVIQGPIRMPDPALDQIGTGLSNRTTRNHWYVMNTVNATLISPVDKYKLWVYATQCPRVGERARTTCAATSGADLGANAEPWSLPASWDSGKVPSAGEDVEIPPHRHIVLDTNVDVRFLRVLGQLTFDRTKDLVLEADNIEVRGYMRVGTRQFPYTKKARITLRGNRQSPSAPIIHDKLWLGNKVIAVVGSFSAVGSTVANPWARLDATLNVGSTTIRLDRQVEWLPGDRITITPTEYGPAETETFEIASVAGNKQDITLKTAARFRHFAGTINVGSGSPPVRLAAAVGLLSRNIVIEGRLSGGGTDTYGAHVYVAEVPNPEPRAAWIGAGKSAASWKPVVHTGSLDMAFVEMRNTGQGAMEAERSSVYFEYGLTTEVTENPSNVIEGCAFADSHNYGVFARNTKHLRLVKNVLHSVARSGIDLDAGCDNATIVNNLVVGLRRSPDASPLWAVPRAGIALDRVPAVMRGNVVGGSHDAGFTVRMPWCTTPGVVAASDPFSNNEAHATVIGAFLLSDTTGQPRESRCRQFSGFTAWKASHVGILTVDQSAHIILKDVRVLDNHIGISLNFFRMGTERSYAHVLNSVIAGSTEASTCSASTTCRAVGEADVVPVGCNSVYGPTVRRVGMMTTQYTNRGKTCEHDFLPFCYPKNKPERMCSMPWEKRYGLPGTRHAEVHVQNTVISSFADNDCGMKSRAIAHNPSQSDYTPPVYLSGMTWHATNESARFMFQRNGWTQECQAGCDGFFHIVMHDKDGTTTGTAGGLVTGDNPELVAPAPYCVARPAWPGFVCAGKDSEGRQHSLRHFVFESTDFADRGHRRLGPLKVERPVLGSTVARNVSSIGPIDDGCAKRFHFAQFNYAAQENTEHRIRFAATMSSTMRLHFHSQKPQDKILASLFVQRPNVIDLFVNGRQVQMNQNAQVPTINDPEGTYIFNPQERRLIFVMRGHANQPIRQYDIRRTPAVQLNMTLAVSVENFVADKLVDNLAVLLSIDKSRIKVVDVQPGSVAVTTAIVDSEPPSTDPVKTVAQVVRLAEVAKQVIQAAQDPVALSSALQVEVATMTMDISRPSIIEAPQDGGNSNDTNYNATALQAAGVNVTEIQSLGPPDALLSGSLEAQLQSFLAAEQLPDNSDLPDNTGTTNTNNNNGPFVLVGPKKEVPKTREGLSTALIAGIAVGAAFAGVVILGGLYVLSRRGRRAERVRKMDSGADPVLTSKSGGVPGKGVEFGADNPTWSAHTRNLTPTQPRPPSLRVAALPAGDTLVFARGASALPTRGEVQTNFRDRSSTAGNATDSRSVAGVTRVAGRSVFSPKTTRGKQQVSDE